MAVTLLISPPGAGRSEPQVSTSLGSSGPKAQVVIPQDTDGVTALMLAPLVQASLKLWWLLMQQGIS